MLNAAAKVCAIILVITIFCEKCYSLEIYYKHEVNNDLYNDEDLIAPETINYAEQYFEKPVAEIPKQPESDLLKLLFGKKWYQSETAIEYNKIEDEQNKNGSEDTETAVKSRVVRQAYPGQAPLYPKLPSSSPYNQHHQYPNYNSQNPQWQPTNNYSQQGYATNGGSSFLPSAQYNSSYGQQPYNPSQNQNPYNNVPYNSNPPYSGYMSPNTTVYNPGMSRPTGPPYNPYGQINNNTYSGYTTKTPGYRPSNTMTPYNPSQQPTYYSTTPNNRHPAIYNYTTSRPSYNNHNTSYWNSGSSGSNAPYGQNPQYYNSYPNNPYKQPNSTSSHNIPNQPYHSPSNVYPTNNNNNSGSYYGQNSQSFNSFPQRPTQNPYNPNGQYAGSNNYPGNSYGSDTYNLSNGNNPLAPNRPPYGSGPAQSNVRYPPGNNGIAYDPTKVSPEYFSYLH